MLYRISSPPLTPRSAPDDPGPSSTAAWLAQIVTLTMVYLLLAYSMSKLLRLTYMASPICLHAGIALAALMCWGRRMAPVAFLGHALFTLAISMENGSQSVGGVVGFGLGALLQALTGHWLISRLVRLEPLELTETREILLFVLIGGLVTPAVGASVGVLTLFFCLNVTATEQFPGIWLDFWLSNGLGILVAAPIMLALVARPREVWMPRRMSLALPLLMAALLLTLAMASLGRWDHQKRFADFHREAQLAAISIESALRESLAVLAASHGLLAAEPDISREAFKAASERFVPKHAAIDFVAYAEALPGDAGRMNISRLEPPAHAPEGLGRDIRGIPDLRAALGKAERTGLPIASAAFVAKPAAAFASAAIRTVLVQTVHAGPNPITSAIQDTSTGLAPGAAVLVALDPQALVSATVAHISSQLMGCLTDAEPDARFILLAGKPGCQQHSLSQPDLIQRVQFAGRQWMLRLYPASTLPMYASPSTQVVAGFSVLSIGLFVALLLTLSARTHRVESLVVQRTAQLRRASQAQRINEQRFRSVFDNAPVGVVVSELDGAPVDANPQFCQMLGCELHELAALHRPFLHEDAELARQLIEGKASTGQRRLRTYTSRSGRTIQAVLMISLLRDAQGEPESLVSVVQDITDHLRLRENEQARQAAEMANQAKSEFLSHMSHELRTPLNALLGFAQLLQVGSEPTLSPQQKAWVVRISQAGWHLLAMINDIMELSRIETGNLRVSLECQDMHRLADEVQSLLADAATRRRISIGAQLDAEARHVIGDGTRIREILNNLISNAIKYNVEGGHIELRLRLAAATAGQVDFSVRDTGPGLTAEQLAAMFQPFNRLGQERGHIEGTGIGLVISRRLAHLMNGELSVSSEPGRGSIFTLRLPVAIAPVQTDASAAAPASMQASLTGVHRLTYIEDNPVNIEVMRAVIALRSQFELTVYEDGTSGLPAVLADPPDLVMLDMHLPDGDGLSLLREIRRAPQCAATIVVMVSADAVDEQIQQCREAGAAHYLTKPFDVRNLLAQVDRLLAARDQA